MAIPLVYNVRNVIQRPVSTLTTAIGIGLTVAIFIGALALAAGFRAALITTGRPDNAIVMRKGADSEISSGIALDAVQILRALPDIATGPGGRPQVSPELVVVVTKERLGFAGSSNVNVRGVDPAAIGVRGDVRIVAGRMFRPGSDEVIVGRRIAPRFANCAIGDRIQFQQRTFTVVGHFAAGGSMFESEIWGDAAVLGPALNRAGVFQSVVFRMRDPAAFPALKRRLETDPRLQVQVLRERDFYDEQSRLFTGIVTGIGVFITLIMAVGAIFGAMNTMFAAVGARTREIAMLLVLGFTPFAVMTSFMAESVILALVGGVIGCLLALPINGITTSTTNFASFSELAFAFRVTPAALVAGLVFSGVLGFVGGIIPAWRAAHRPLASSLREL